MTTATAANVQKAVQVTSRQAGPSLADAAATAASLNAAGTSIETFITQQFELNQNATGMALEAFNAITGTTEATSALLDQFTAGQRVNLAAYPTLPAAQLPQAAADDLGAQFASNATGSGFRSTNNLSQFFGATPAATAAQAATFDITGFVTNQITSVLGASFATPTVIAFEAQRFSELMNRFQSLALGFQGNPPVIDPNDKYGIVRAAGAVVAELVNQGEQANVGNLHSGAVAFSHADANGTAPYGGTLQSLSGNGTPSNGAPTGIQGNTFVLAAAADVVPTATLNNINDDLINGFATPDSLLNNDNINGGNGFDILGAAYTAATTNVQANIQNVEEILIKNTGAALLTFNTATVQGAQQLWSFGSTGAGGVAFTNVVSSAGTVTPIIGLGGGNQAATTDSLSLAGGVVNATVNVQLDNYHRTGPGTGTFQTTGIKTENFNLALASGNLSLPDPDTTVAQGKFAAAIGSNTNYLVLGETDTQLTTVTFKGAGTVNLTETAAVQGSLTSVDASALTTTASSAVLPPMW